MPLTVFQHGTSCSLEWSYRTRPGFRVYLSRETGMVRVFRGGWMVGLLTLWAPAYRRSPLLWIGRRGGGQGRNYGRALGIGRWRDA